jgi:hypothetical protein
MPDRDDPRHIVRFPIRFIGALSITYCDPSSSIAAVIFEGKYPGAMALTATCFAAEISP